MAKTNDPYNDPNYIPSPKYALPDDVVTPPPTHEAPSCTITFPFRVTQVSPCEVVLEAGSDLVLPDIDVGYPPSTPPDVMEAVNAAARRSVIEAYLKHVLRVRVR